MARNLNRFFPNIKSPNNKSVDLRESRSSFWTFSFEGLIGALLHLAQALIEILHSFFLAILFVFLSLYLCTRYLSFPIIKFFDPFLLFWLMSMKWKSRCESFVLKHFRYFWNYLPFSSEQIQDSAQSYDFHEKFIFYF